MRWMVKLSARLCNSRESAGKDRWNGIGAAEAYALGNGKVICHEVSVSGCRGGRLTHVHDLCGILSFLFIAAGLALICWLREFWKNGYGLPLWDIGD